MASRHSREFIRFYGSFKYFLSRPRIILLLVDFGGIMNYTDFGMCSTRSTRMAALFLGSCSSHRGVTCGLVERLRGVTVSCRFGDIIIRFSDHRSVLISVFRELSCRFMSRALVGGRFGALIWFFLCFFVFLSLLFFVLVACLLDSAGGPVLVGSCLVFCGGWVVGFSLVFVAFVRLLF